MDRCLLVLAAAATLAGCTSDAADLEPIGLEGDTASSAVPFELAAEATIGWLAGAGLNMGATADASVGVRAPDACPRILFLVPPDSTVLRMTIAPGPTLATIAITANEQVWYYTPLPNGPAIEFEEPTPAAGVWAVELKPSGIVANEARAVSIALSGSAPAPVEHLLLREDHDCLR